MKKHAVILLFSALSLTAYAQEEAERSDDVPAAAPEVPVQSKPKSGIPVGEATISLQTTVTGNQEQPRVLYILPWQSPLSGDIEFQTLSSQQDEVFGHLEREELRRSLEAEEVLNKSKP